MKLVPTVVVVGSIVWLAGCGSKSPARDAAAGVDTSTVTVPADGPSTIAPDAAAVGTTDSGAAVPPADTSAPPPDASADTSPPASADGGSADRPPDPPLPAPLEACPTASIDRLTQWIKWSPPPQGSILAKDGAGYVANGQLSGADWDQIVVYLMNSMDRQVDLGKSSGFWLTYSATDDFYAQLRPAPPLYNGAHKHVVKIPSTTGQVVTRFFPFVASSWTIIPALGAPDYPFTDALKTAVSFDFTGRTANTIVFKGLRLDGVVPPCN